MPPPIQHLFAKVFEPPPIPVEAFPPGLFGKSPITHALMEQAWRTMFYTTLVQGMIVGGLVVLVLIVAVIVRLNLRSAIHGAITDATHS